MVPAVATLVIFHQWYRQDLHDISPWKGGGMGMFSSVDSPVSRSVSVFGVALDGVEHQIKHIRPDQLRIVEELRAEPTIAKLQKLGCSILTTDWWLNLDSASPTPASRLQPFQTGDSTRVKLQTVELKVYKLIYQPKRRAVNSALIKHARVSDCSI